MFKVGAVAALAGVAILGKLAKDSIGEAREAQVVTARTENVIASMGNAAKISSEQVAAMAGRLSNVTGIDDEAIQSGQNLLLTFGKIRNYVDGEFTGTFDSATALMVDMSAAMGTDMKGSAIQLGKALNDPVKGITALTRVGVSFTEQQKKQIETLVESGNVVGAQNVILGELQKQFGGAAEAMATPADKARTAFANLQEQLGTALLPVVDAVLNAFVRATPAISGFIAGISGGGGIIAGITTLGQSVGTQLLPLLQTMSQTFTGVILPAVIALATYLSGQLAPVFSQIAAIVTGQVIPIIVSLGQFIYGTLYPAVVAVVTAVASQLRPVFEALVSLIRGSILPTIQALIAKFRENQPAIETVVTAVVKIIGKVLEFAAAILGAVLPPLIRFAGFLIRNVVPAIADVIGFIARIIGALIDFGRVVIARIADVAAFVVGVKQKFGEAVDFVQGIPGKIKAALGQLGSVLFISGADLIRGFINGIISMAKAAADAAKDVAIGAKIGVETVLGIKSPSRVFHEIGRYAMEGFANGIGDNAVKVLDKLKELRDGIKSSIDGIRGEFTSLSDSIASAFTGNLFEAETADSFIDSLFDTRGQLRQLKGAFRQLMEWGFKPGFLSALFESGNAGLILDLASGSRSQAAQGAALFGDVQSLSGQLGNSVARDVLGPKLDRMNDRLRDVESAIKQVGRDVGRELNGAVSTSGRRG